MKCLTSRLSLICINPTPLPVTKTNTASAFPSLISAWFLPHNGEEMTINSTWGQRTDSWQLTQKEMWWFAFYLMMRPTWDMSWMYPYSLHLSAKGYGINQEHPHQERISKHRPRRHSGKMAEWHSNTHFRCYSMEHWKQTGHGRKVKWWETFLNRSNFHQTKKPIEVCNLKLNLTTST